MIPQNRETAQRRLELLAAFFYLGVFALVLRLIQVQVIQNEFYARAAERNRTQLIRQTAPRGRIYDRNGEIIATNQAVFSLIYLPGGQRDSRYLPDLARDLAPYVDEEPAKLLETLHRAVQEKTAIRLAEKLPLQVMFKLSELKTIYPGVHLIKEAGRYYPNGAFAAHLLGHMGQMDEASWLRLKSQGYRVDSWIGRSGLEKIFEPELHGQDGGIRMEVDARGRMRRILETIDWKQGANITLTIDSKLQKAAEDALRRSSSKRGAVVAMDPRDGEILALASVPDYDPNWFLLSDADKAAINFNDIPAFNLALQGEFPPGSTFKIVSSAAMLNEGRVNPEERVYCPGYFMVGSHKFLCWELKGHGFENWLGALTHSCDVYFYKMGLKTGGDLIEKYEREFHIGELTHIVLSGETRGHEFGPQERRSERRPWFDGDTANLAIGQGELLVTPLQMAVLMGAVANGGVLWRPRLVSRIQYTDGRSDYVGKPEKLGTVDLEESTWNLLRAGLENVVREGTGAGTQIPGLVIGGKTGTAQNPNGKDHAWFVTYAGKPGVEPSLAVAVLVQFGGHGSAVAVPVARQVIQAAFPAPVPPEPANAAVGPIGPVLRPVVPPILAH